MIRHHHLSIAIFTFTAFLSPATRAAAPSLEEEVRQLAAEVKALRQENRQLRADLGLEGRAGQSLVRPAGREPTLSVGGFLQAQADFGDKGDARFTSSRDRIYLRRARLNLQGRFLEELDFRIEGEFAGSLGEGSGSRAQLTDGYINWKRFAAAGVRVGQFKTPFGYEQLHSDPKLATIERTLANDRLTVGRQIGVQVGGDLYAKRVAYAAGVFNGTGVNTNANDSDAFLWAGRASTVAWQGSVSGVDVRWTAGGNALSSNDASLTGQPAEFGFDSVPGGTQDNVFAGRRVAWGLDTQLHAGRFDLAFEYLRARFQPRDQLPSARFEADGWYAQAAYHVIPGTLQAVVKYDEFDPNRSMPTNGTATWTLGVNCFLKADDLKLQLDYLHTDIDGAASQSEKFILRLQSIF